MSYLDENPEHRFSRDKAHIIIHLHYDSLVTWFSSEDPKAL